jgi:hypothetical protein
MRWQLSRITRSRCFFGEDAAVSMIITTFVVGGLRPAWLYQAAEKDPGARRCGTERLSARRLWTGRACRPASIANAAEDVLGRNPQGNSYLRLQRRWHHGQGMGPAFVMPPCWQTQNTLLRHAPGLFQQPVTRGKN